MGRTLGGLDNWQQVDLEETPERIRLPRIEISEINVHTDRIEFKVDKTGVPVIVKTADFPNWKTKGAECPWRATPNLMVVVPTEKEVLLEYGRSPIEILSIFLTLAGVILLVLTARKPNYLDFSSAWFDSNTIISDVDERLKRWSQSGS